MLEKPKDLERHKAVDQLLNMDSVAVSEKLIGGVPIDASETAQKLGIGMEFNKTSMLRKVMVDTGDFAVNDSWERRKIILERNGFHLVWDRHYTFEGRKRCQVVMVEIEHGLIYTQDTVAVMEDGKEYMRVADHGKCYFCWFPVEEKYRGIMPTPGSGGWESVKYPDWRNAKPTDGHWFTPEDLYFRGYINGERGLIHNLQSLLLKGQFMNVWPEWPNLQCTMFITEPDLRELARANPKYSHVEVEAINRARYDAMGEEVHKIINLKK